MNNCLRCRSALINSRRKFCSEHCKYIYNVVKKENESSLAPPKKRNKKYFSMVIGYSNSLKGQGKRSCGMVKGSMAAIVNVTNEVWAEVNYDNIKKHFTSISFWQPSYIKLGDETIIYKNNIESELGIKIDF